MSHSVPFIILRVVGSALNTWLGALRDACIESAQRGVLVDFESARKKGGSEFRSFIFVDFNAWEYAGSEVLWAALMTKIFDAVRDYLSMSPVPVIKARVSFRQVTFLPGRICHKCKLVRFSLSCHTPPSALTA